VSNPPGRRPAPYGQATWRARDHSAYSCGGLSFKWTIAHRLTRHRTSHAPRHSRSRSLSCTLPRRTRSRTAFSVIARMSTSSRSPVPSRPFGLKDAYNRLRDPQTAPADHVRHWRARSSMLATCELRDHISDVECISRATIAMQRVLVRLFAYARSQESSHRGPLRRQQQKGLQAEPRSSIPFASTTPRTGALSPPGERVLVSAICIDGRRVDSPVSR